MKLALERNRNCLENKSSTLQFPLISETIIDPDWVKMYDALILADSERSTTEDANDRG